MSKPEGASPIGVSNVDMKTDVWLVMHNGQGHEVVLVEDFNEAAKQHAEELRLTEVRAEGKKKRYEKLLKRNATLVGQRNTTKKQLAECRALLTKLRDSGSWHWSAVELNVFEGVDGEALLAEIEALTGPRVQQ